MARSLSVAAAKQWRAHEQLAGSKASRLSSFGCSFSELICVRGFVFAPKLLGRALCSWLQLIGVQPPQTSSLTD